MLGTEHNAPTRDAQSSPPGGQLGSSNLIGKGASENGTYLTINGIKIDESLSTLLSFAGIGLSFMGIWISVRSVRAAQQMPFTMMRAEQVRDRVKTLVELRY